MRNDNLFQEGLYIWHECKCNIWPSITIIKLISENMSIIYSMYKAGRGTSIGCTSAWYADGGGIDPHVRQNILSLRFGHETVSTTILSLPLIQEGQLSVTGEEWTLSTGKLPRRLAKEQYG